MNSATTSTCRGRGRPEERAAVSALVQSLRAQHLDPDDEDTEADAPRSAGRSINLARQDDTRRERAA